MKKSTSGSLFRLFLRLFEKKIFCKAKTLDRYVGIVYDSQGDYRWRNL